MAQVAQRPLPEFFVIKMYLGNREGYALYRWTDGGNDNDNRQIHAIRSSRHGELYYTIIQDITLPIEYTTVQSKKAQGNVVRPMTWKYTRSVLRYTGAHGNRLYPEIRITNMSSALPSVRSDTFIPLVNNNPPAQVQNVQNVQNVPEVVPEVVPNVPKQYTITAIPQHAVRAFLRDAAMQEEVCSITGDEIDIVNGAMTSCFHLFEKNAIAMWLAMPNSRDKCPVCNSKCNMFTVDSHVTQVQVPQEMAVQ